jgi:phosphate transport system substrate-binding protein
MKWFRSSRTGWLAGLAASIAVGALLAGCGGGDDTTAATNTAAPGTPAASATGGPAATPTAAGLPANIGKDDSAQLTGAGATFPTPIYQAWFDDYNKKIAKGVAINYQSIGSGGGVQQFTQNTVDFGASDAPLSDDEVSKATDVQHIPMVLGSVVVTYNLGALSAPLKFDGDTLAKIYLGTIKKWDDPVIAALNPGVKLPSADIQVVYRSDGSGTSFVWTDYLSKVSADWKSKVGTSKNPQWPAGQGGKGNEGVTNAVKQTPNAIGYVELNYAIATKLPFADVKNKAGKFVTPSIDSTSAAAAGVALPADYRVSITNADGDAAYPVASFTYLLVYKSTGKCSSQTPLADFLWWVFHDSSATATAKELNYAPVPSKLLPTIEATIKALKCDGGSKASLKGG